MLYWVWSSFKYRFRLTQAYSQDKHMYTLRANVTGSDLHWWTGCSATLLSDRWWRTRDGEVVKASTCGIGKKAGCFCGHTFHHLASGVHAPRIVISGVIVWSPGKDNDIAAALPVQHQIRWGTGNCKCVGKGLKVSRKSMKIRTKKMGNTKQTL